MYNFIFRSVSATGLQKLRKTQADTFDNALSKALEKYGHIRYFSKYNGLTKPVEIEVVHKPKQKLKKMDLVSALEHAKKASKQHKKTYYIVTDLNTGECDVLTAPIGNPTHKFKDGVEDKKFYAEHKAAVAKEVEATKNQTSAGKAGAPGKDSAKNKNNKTMATKAAKKSAKKATKKVSTPRVSFKDGKKVTMTNKEMTVKIKKGFKYYTPQGVNKTKYIPERPNQELVNENYFEIAPEKG